MITVDYPELHKKVRPGDIFLIDDGATKFKIREIKKHDLVCTALNDGVIKNRKGLNFPDISFEREYLSEQDKKLVRFAIKHNLTFLGLSYVNSKEDVENVKRLLKGTPIKIVSKIETKKALENYFDIIDSSYGIMIDRGDLGSEVSIEKLPKLQKRIINECNIQGKPVIIATQMMDSMTRNPFPTKSEITDVANAVLDGASALMLSQETAVGNYPVETVKTMKNIIQEIEDEVSFTIHDERIDQDNYTDIIGFTINQILKKIAIDKIICITSGGFSARMLSRYKFNVPLIAITNDCNIVKRLNLLWGVIPIKVDEDIDNSVSVEQKKTAVVHTINQGLVDIDDTILLTGAVFPNNRKIINMVEIHKVRELLGFFKMKNQE